MNTKSRVKSLDLRAELKIKIFETRVRRRRRFWKRTSPTDMVRLSVEGAPSIWLGPNDILTVTHRVTEAN